MDKIYEIMKVSSFSIRFLENQKRGEIVEAHFPRRILVTHFSQEERIDRLEILGGFLKDPSLGDHLLHQFFSFISLVCHFHIDFVFVILC